MSSVKKCLPWLVIVHSIFAVIHAGDRPAPRPVGVQGEIGCLANPKTASRLEISKSGVYENYRIDAQGKTGNTVKITANDVTVRHCEIFNGSGNGIGVFGTNVTIENCRIHHMLNGSFKDQKDAHGITGRWGNVTIRNCDISCTSGDSIQFDPDRKSQGQVLVEDCNLWTGPLPADAAGFKAGERPGENAIDTKTKPPSENKERCKLTVRNCYMYGWNQPAQIGNAAALNLKENILAEVTHCVFADNEIAFRVRGPSERGGAHVMISNCAIYSTQFGVRAENKIEKLVINRLAFGKDVATRIRFVNGQPTAGYQSTGEAVATEMEEILKNGFSQRD